MRRTVMVLLAGICVLIPTYWTVWFTNRPVLATSPSAAYVEFENAFVLADLVVVGFAALALVALVRNRPDAVLWGLLACGGAVFLFCMDFLYGIQHQVWRHGSAGAIELTVQVLTLTFAVVVGSWLWRNRRTLDPR